MNLEKKGSLHRLSVCLSSLIFTFDEFSEDQIDVSPFFVVQTVNYFIMHVLWSQRGLARILTKLGYWHRIYSLNNHRIRAIVMMIVSGRDMSTNKK